MQLTPHIHLVASGTGGLDLTDPYDCNAYLIVSDGEAALVDTGIGWAVEELLANAAAAGCEADAIRYVLLTHAHPDHAGGAAELAERLPRARVLASPEVAGWVSSGDEEAMSLERGKRAGFYPRAYRFRACPPAEPLDWDDSLEVGSLSIDALPTPGHAAGHVAYIAGDACFCGDLVFYGGRISLGSHWDCSLRDYADSVRRLSLCSFEALLPGHHEPSLRHGRRHVEAAAQSFASGFVPQSVV